MHSSWWDWNFFFPWKTSQKIKKKWLSLLCVFWCFCVIFHILLHFLMCCLHCHLLKQTRKCTFFYDDFFGVEKNSMDTFFLSSIYPIYKNCRNWLFLLRLSSSSSCSVPSRPQHHAEGPVPLLPGASHPRRQAVRLRPGLSARRRRGRPLPWVHRDIRARNPPTFPSLRLPGSKKNKKKTPRPGQPYWFAFNEAAASGPMRAVPAWVLPKSYAWLAFLTLDVFGCCCYFSPLSLRAALLLFFPKAFARNDRFKYADILFSSKPPRTLSAAVCLHA